MTRRPGRTRSRGSGCPATASPSSRPPSQLQRRAAHSDDLQVARAAVGAAAVVDRDQQLAVVGIGLDVDAVDQRLVAELAAHPLGDAELDRGDRQLVEPLEDRAVEADAEARGVDALAGRGEQHREDLVAQVAVGVVGDGDRAAVVAQLERLVDEELGHHVTGVGGEMTGGKTTIVDSASVWTPVAIWLARALTGRSRFENTAVIADWAALTAVGGDATPGAEHLPGHVAHRAPTASCMPASDGVAGLDRRRRRRGAAATAAPPPSRTGTARPIAAREPARHRGGERVARLRRRSTGSSPPSGTSQSDSRLEARA